MTVSCKYKSLTISSLALGLSIFTLSACTNYQSNVGQVSTYYSGTITGLELADVNTNEYNSAGNAVLGAMGGALLGGIIADDSTGAWIGASLGGLAGAAGSSYANRQDGVRMTIDSENGPMIVDTYFNCKLSLGKKVRLISGGSHGTEIQLYQNGAYKTLKQNKSTDCPSTYNKIKKGLTSNR